MLARLQRIRRGPLFETVFIAAVAVGLAVAVQAYAVKPYEIPSGSMEPTLDIGQRVLVDRFSTRLGDDPQAGDVIVFHPPVGATESGVPSCSATSAQRSARQVCPSPGTQRSDETFIKRVVAGPGDTLRLVDGIPIVNGVRFTGDFRTVPCRVERDCEFPEPITIPDDEYFMLGDNRPNSRDSRYWGPVPRDWIIGRAVFTYWPPDRIGTL